MTRGIYLAVHFKMQKQHFFLLHANIRKEKPADKICHENRIHFSVSITAIKEVCVFIIVITT